MKTMKTMRMMIAAALLCGMSMNAQAQSHKYYNTKHEVAFSIGGASNSQILNAISDFSELTAEAFVTSAITGGTIIGATTYENKSEIPVLSVEYYYHVNKVIGLGGILAYNGKTDYMYCNVKDNTTGNTSKEKIGEAKRNNITVMPSAKFDWLRKKHVGLYSKVGLGVSIMKDKQSQYTDSGDKEVDSYTDVVFNFQATVLGFEAGSEKVRGFAEVGMGEQGIFSAGVRCKF